MLFFVGGIMLDKILKKDKWKIYLYYQNRLIKKIYVDDKFKPLDEIYVFKVWFKKYLMGSWFTQIVVRPKALKFTDNDKKQVHIEVEMFGGV
jgi:hypothetical protein